MLSGQMLGTLAERMHPVRVAAFEQSRAIKDMVRRDDERKFCELILFGSVEGVHQRLELWVWYRLNVYPRYLYIADRIDSAIDWLMDVFRCRLAAAGPDNQAAMQLQLA